MITLLGKRDLEALGSPCWRRGTWWHCDHLAREEGPGSIVITFLGKKDLVAL